MKLFVSATDTYQLLSGAPGGALPVSSSRRLQLRSKRLSTRSSSGSGLQPAAASWIRRASGQSSTLCGVLVLLPWFAFILLGALLWRVRLHSHLPPVVQEVPGGKQCLGWRQTYFCHPFA
jgi:hypothetical protein